MTLITLTAVATMVIILIEERVYMMEKQESYQLFAYIRNALWKNRRSYILTICFIVE